MTIKAHFRVRVRVRARVRLARQGRRQTGTFINTN